MSYQPAQCPRQAGIDLGPVGLIDVFCRQVTSLRAFCFTARIRDNMQQNHVISLLRQACRDDIDFSLSLSLSICSRPVLHVSPCTVRLLSYQPEQCPRQVGIDAGAVFHIFPAVCDSRCYL